MSQRSSSVRLGSGDDYAKWTGVQVDMFRRIVGLEWCKQNLKGGVPLELGNISTLKMLNFKDSPDLVCLPATMHSLKDQVERGGGDLLLDEASIVKEEDEKAVRHSLLSRGISVGSMSLESRHSQLIGGRDSPETRVRLGSSAMSVEFMEFDHSWDFRLGMKGNSANAIEVKDECSGLVAKLGGGAKIAKGGVELDGKTSFVNIDRWRWGGATSIEVMVKGEKLKERDFARIFDFRNEDNTEEVSMYNWNNEEADNQPRITWCVKQGANAEGAFGDDALFDQGEFTHLVVTTENKSMKIYKNGKLIVTDESGFEPETCTRANNLVGALKNKKGELEGYFGGTVAYLRLWHDHALPSTHVSYLYSTRDLPADKPKNVKRGSLPEKPCVKAHGEEVKEYQDEIAKLKKDLERFKVAKPPVAKVKVNNEQAAEIKRLMEDVKRLRGDLERFEADKVKKVTELREINNQHTTDMQRLENALVQLKKDNESEKKKSKDAEKKNKDVERRLSIMPTSAPASSPGSLDATRLTRENARLKREKENLDEQTREHKSEVRRLEQELDKLQQELNSKEFQEKKLNNEAKSLKVDHVKKLTEIETLNRNVKSAKESAASTRTKLQQIIDVMKAEIEADKQAHIQEVAELQTRVTKLEGEKSVIKQESNQTIQKLERELETETHHTLSAKNECNLMKMDIKTLKDSLSQVKAGQAICDGIEVVELRRSNIDLKKRLDREMGKVDELTETVAANARMMQHVEANVKYLEDSYSGSIKSVKERDQTSTKKAKKLEHELRMMESVVRQCKFEAEEYKQQAVEHGEDLISELVPHHDAKSIALDMKREELTRELLEAQERKNKVIEEMKHQLALFQQSESEKERAISSSTRGNRRISVAERNRLENTLSSERISNHIVISSYREKLVNVDGNLHRLSSELKSVTKEIERGKRKVQRERRRSVQGRLA
ncbi:hypothetical protein TL16_g10365 [Triparma laevis f. inornata]|uniref:Uncharacterized protein n=1 Tax=Triparma laevis f. inornata TaxID=1714386 RepID=A0A9W7B7X4_9STRA|nr:hypothetical protein TL16_g10365 [Triparma laevis f. inornata]